MNKIVILYICTGQYDIFWKDFFESCEQYFLPYSEKHYFVFTDAKYIFAEENCERIHKIYQKSLGWPDNTLKRFHIFLTKEEQLKKFDFIFFMNANVLFVQNITEKEFLPQKNLVFVQQAGSFTRTNIKFTYERNKNSTAFIQYGEGKYYVSGAVNGGKVISFLELCHILKNNIDTDLENNIIALWHDESHLNKYILNRDDYTILSPAYCYPENIFDYRTFYKLLVQYRCNARKAKLPFPAKILLRDKNKYININVVKNRGICRYIMKFKNYIKGILLFSND